MQGRSGWGVVWGLVAATAVVVGFGIAVLAGYLLGHFTGDKTETVTVGGSQRTGDGAAARDGEQAAVRVARFTDPGMTAGDNWLVNGGGYSNMRFSQLDQINKDNVGQLKGKFLTHLKGSGTANKYSQEGTPIEENGILYVPTGEDDIFAVDAVTGDIKWQWEANLPA